MNNLMSFATLVHLTGPALVLAIAAFVIMLYELIVPQREAKMLAPWLSVIATIGALLYAILRLGATVTTVPSQIVLDDFGTIFAILLLIATLIVLLLAIASKGKHELPFEYSYLILFATVGAIIMTSAFDLITMYVGLELLSITSYVLVALYRHQSKSAEASMKYLIVGSIASATILYGMTFLYGISGSTNLAAIASAMQTGWTSYASLAYLALGLIVTGIGVKISAVPFHLWTADVYEGAPTPVTAYLAVVSKAAVFALFIRLTYGAFASNGSVWFSAVAWLAVITMIVGNFGALAQKNVKRMLAYSSIGNAGYLLVPFAIAGLVATTNSFTQNLSALMYYLFAYAFMTIGAFAIYTIVTKEEGAGDFNAFTGLFARNPILASAMTLFLLALAGMPLTGGFIGKVMIFLAAFSANQYWLGIILFATSVVAFYYYFGVIKAMFAKPEGEAIPLRVAPLMQVVILICAMGIVWLGIFPGTLNGVLNGLHWFG